MTSVASWEGLRGTVVDRHPCVRGAGSEKTHYYYWAADWAAAVRRIAAILPSRTPSVYLCSHDVKDCGSAHEGCWCEYDRQSGQAEERQHALILQPANSDLRACENLARVLSGRGRRRSSRTQPIGSFQTLRVRYKLPSCDENDVHELYIDVSKVGGQYYAVIISSLTEERMLAFDSLLFSMLAPGFSEFVAFFACERRIQHTASVKEFLSHVPNAQEVAGRVTTAFPSFGLDKGEWSLAIVFSSWKLLKALGEFIGDPAVCLDTFGFVAYHASDEHAIADLFDARGRPL